MREDLERSEDLVLLLIRIRVGSGWWSVATLAFGWRRVRGRRRMMRWILEGLGVVEYGVEESEWERR